MITVYDFMNMCVNEEQPFILYDMTKSEEVWKGTQDDIPYEYQNMLVWSFDGVLPILYGGKAPEAITLNIETE